MGVLLGRPEVKSPAQLEALWREMQPGRRMELRVSPRGDRLFVIEHEHDEGSEIARGAGEIARDRGEIARGVGEIARGAGEIARGAGEIARDRGEMTLEIVMLPTMRHAFPIHHWRPRPWQAS